LLLLLICKVLHMILLKMIKRYQFTEDQRVELNLENE
ncbi:hypothetical protein CP02DC14_1246, partial [Chlamydia psittaci 02DC14]